MSERTAVEALDDLAAAVHAIAHGGVAGPGGLEALGMSVEGPGKPGHNPLSDAIKDGFEVLAQAHQTGLQEIANAIRSSR